MRSGGSCAPASSTAAAATMPVLSPIQGASQAHTPPRPRIDLQGQMSLKLAAFAGQPAKGLSLGFFFSGNTDRGQLDLMTLMGSQMAQVNWQPGEAWLTNDKGKGRYDDIDALSQAALGEAVPLRQLVFWMQGMPDPDLPSRPGAEPDTFLQEGWLIDAHELPIKKLNARREATPQRRAVQIKVYLDR
jgi:outer membrane lipoprotein LolB